MIKSMTYNCDDAEPLKGNSGVFLYFYIRKYSEKLDEQKKSHLKSNLCSRVMGFLSFTDDVTGAKKPFYHANPYIID